MNYCLNYCVYNKDLDQFLFLFYRYECDVGNCKAEWGDEFVYALADPNFTNAAETVWPMDTEDKRGYYSAFVYRRIKEMNTSKNGMKDVRFVPITDGIPDFEKECAF